MDFTYPTAFVLALLSSLAIACITVLICKLGKTATPKGYRRYVALLVILFVIAISYRWSGWRAILLTGMGLMDLGFVSLFALGGAFLGTVPLRVVSKELPRAA
jgi:hypothetical protein